MDDPLEPGTGICEENSVDPGCLDDGDDEDQTDVEDPVEPDPITEQPHIECPRGAEWLNPATGGVNSYFRVLPGKRTFCVFLPRTGHFDPEHDDPDQVDITMVKSQIVNRSSCQYALVNVKVTNPFGQSRTVTGGQHATPLYGASNRFCQIPGRTPGACLDEDGEQIHLVPGVYVVEVSAGPNLAGMPGCDWLEMGMLSTQN